MHLHWVLGLPGAGKTTCILAVRSGLPRMTEVAWTADDMGTEERRAEMGKATIHFTATDGYSIVLLGRFEGAKAERTPELVGTDCYTSRQRNTVKALLGELASRGKTTHVILEGLILLNNKPLRTRVSDVFASVTSYVLGVDRGLCQTRFRERNEDMVGRGDLKFYPTKFNHEETWDRIQQRMDDWRATPGVTTADYPDSDAASAALLAALRLPTLRRSKRLRVN